MMFASEHMQRSRRAKISLFIWATILLEASLATFGLEGENESCFTDNNLPSCRRRQSSLGDDDSHKISETLNVNAECVKLDKILSPLGVVWENTTIHAQAFASHILANTTHCLVAQHVYADCYWCAPEAGLTTIHERDDNDSNNPNEAPFCQPDCNAPRFVNESVNPVEACRRLQAFFLQQTYPATVEACYEKELVYHECGFTCKDDPRSELPSGPSESSCFSNDSPPSCDPLDAASQLYLESIPDLNIERECQKLAFPLTVFDVEYDLDRHVQALADVFITDTDECVLARLVYPSCFFCAPAIIPAFASIQADFCWSNCDEPKADLGVTVDDYNLNASCAKLSMFNYSTPQTLEGCIEATLVSPHCGFCHLPDEPALPEPDETSCFTYQNPPTCNSPAGSDEFVDPRYGNEECMAMEEMMFPYAVWTDLDVHVNAFSRIQANTDECDMVRQYYHRCYWCTPTPPHHDNLAWDYCAYTCQKPPVFFPDTAPTDALCDKLHNLVVEDSQFPATIDTCRWWDQASWACSFLCSDGSPLQERTRKGPPPPQNISKTRSASATAFDQFKASLPNISETSCYTIDDPPSCNHEDDYDVVSLALDVQDECFRLERRYLYPNGIVFEPDYHIYAFADMEKYSAECIRFRRVYHLCYFCRDEEPVTESWCELSKDSCRVGGFRNPGNIDTSVNTAATCGEIEELLVVRQQLPATTKLCRRTEVSLFSCEFWCNSYLGARTTEQKRALVWVARVSSLFSFLGAIFIIYDVLANKQNQRSVYHRLLLGMAIFDIVTALAWVFSTAAIPEEEALHVVGAVGNWSTCKAQAFFVQLGFTSVFYNVSLALYYALVVVRGWREADLKQVHTLLHIAPTLLGFGLAFGVIPYANWIYYGCHVPPPPDGPRWQSLVFVVIPVGFSILCITGSMTYMYLHVRNQARASRKWNWGVGSHRNLETQVFWRALLYTISFLFTWPLMFAVYTASLDYKMESFVLSLIVSFVAPLQGFNNFLVYVVPRITRSVAYYSSQFLSLMESRQSSTKRSSSNRSSENNPVPLDPSAAIERKGTEPAPPTRLQLQRYTRRSRGSSSKPLPDDDQWLTSKQVSPLSVVFEVSECFTEDAP